MEARLGYIEYELRDNIIELLSMLDMEDAYETIKILPEEFREDAQNFLKELYESVEIGEDYEYENPEEHFNKFITHVKLNHRFLLGWDEVLEEIGRGYYKMKRKREKKEYYAAKLKEIKEKQAKSFYKLKISRSEEVEEQEEVDLTDKEEYDLTGTGEPVYETPILTPQLTRRIMANEFSPDQVEYIIKKSLHF